MTPWRDAVDWVGGYQYEFAKSEEIFDFFRAKGFSLVKFKCGCVGLGCNEFVFVREPVRKQFSKSAIQIRSLIDPVAIVGSAATIGPGPGRSCLSNLFKTPTTALRRNSPITGT